MPTAQRSGNATSRKRRGPTRNTCPIPRRCARASSTGSTAHHLDLYIDEDSKSTWRRTSPWRPSARPGHMLNDIVWLETSTRTLIAATHISPRLAALPHAPDRARLPQEIRRSRSSWSITTVDEFFSPTSACCGRRSTCWREGLGLRRQMDRSLLQVVAAKDSGDLVRDSGPKSPMRNGQDPGLPGPEHDLRPRAATSLPRLILSRTAALRTATKDTRGTD